MFHLLESVKMLTGHQPLTGGMVLCHPHQLPARVKIKHNILSFSLTKSDVGELLAGIKAPVSLLLVTGGRRSAGGTNHYWGGETIGSYHHQQCSIIMTFKATGVALIFITTTTFFLLTIEIERDIQSR